MRCVAFVLCSTPISGCAEGGRLGDGGEYHIELRDIREPGRFLSVNYICTFDPAGKARSRPSEEFGEIVFGPSDGVPSSVFLSAISAEEFCETAEISAEELARFADFSVRYQLPSQADRMGNNGAYAAAFADDAVIVRVVEGHLDYTSDAQLKKQRKLIRYKSFAYVPASIRPVQGQGAGEFADEIAGFLSRSGLQNFSGVRLLSSIEACSVINALSHAQTVHGRDRLDSLGQYCGGKSDFSMSLRLQVAVGDQRPMSTPIEQRWIIPFDRQMNELVVIASPDRVSGPSELEPLGRVVLEDVDGTTLGALDLKDAGSGGFMFMDSASSIRLFLFDHKMQRDFEL